MLNLFLHFCCFTAERFRSHPFARTIRSMSASSSSSVATIPPSIVDMWWATKKENVEASPKFPVIPACSSPPGPARSQVAKPLDRRQFRAPAAVEQDGLGSPLAFREGLLEFDAPLPH